jgi:hypothetical protein
MHRRFVVWFVGSCSSSSPIAKLLRTGLLDLEIFLHRILLCGIFRLRTLSKLLFDSEQPPLALAISPTAKSSEPIRLRSFWYPTPAGRRTIFTTTTRSNTRQFNHFFTCYLRALVTLTWHRAFCTRFEGASNIFSRYFAEFFDFQLIAGENSEKHVFYRVSNRFAVNLISITGLP